MATTNGDVSSKPTVEDDAGNLCVPCMINSKPVIQPASASFPVTSSKQDKIIHYGQNATVDIATQAVETAAATFKAYKKTPVHERRRMLLRAAELFEKRAAEGNHRQMLETSCHEGWAQFNGQLTVACIQEIASSIQEAVTGELPPSRHGYNTLVYKEAVGPVLLIPPWNAATILSARSVASILAAGCTVVMKASELCPWTHQFVAETFLEAGFPPGSINMVMADRKAGPEITETIIAHTAIRKVEFIGSAAVGRIIGSVSAKHLKPVFMELGDQSPAIICDDADLHKAAQLCAQGAMLHQGQVCFSTERILVHSSVKDEFSRLLVDAVKNFGQMLGPGAAVTKAAADKAKDTIDAAVADGAKFLFGSSDMNGPASLAPSILTDVSKKSAISTAEAFAPTAFVMGFETEEEAIAEANSRIGGLSASVFTGSFERGLHMARELEFGGVQINNMTLFAEPGSAVTGFKGSGWGSNHGRHGIEEFLYNKSVSLVPTDLK